MSGIAGEGVELEGQDGSWVTGEETWRDVMADTIPGVQVCHIHSDRRAWGWG